MAEANAIINARQDITGCALYVWGLPPCAPCAALIIPSRISEVIYTLEDEDIQRWQDSTSKASQMFHEAGIAIRYIPKENII